MAYHIPAFFANYIKFLCVCVCGKCNIKIYSIHIALLFQLKLKKTHTNTSDIQQMHATWLTKYYFNKRKFNFIHWHFFYWQNTTKQKQKTKLYYWLIEVFLLVVRSSKTEWISYQRCTIYTFAFEPWKKVKWQVVVQSKVSVYTELTNFNKIACKQPQIN